MKIDWKKDDKQFYLPAAKPEFRNIPEFSFFTLEGKGNPNDPFFANYITALYAASYAVKMSPKSGQGLPGYQEYTVYPLEGVWDVDDEAKRLKLEVLDKDRLVFKLMMRQPDFLTENDARGLIEHAWIKKKEPLIKEVKFEKITDGPCVQMLHLGSYDSEPASFAQMEVFAAENKLTRLSKVHREIYLSDARKVSPDKLRTVLRFKVRKG
ncbi:MAG: GyrI-like domain-containing protein [Bacteroidales bacterium]|nr:GyrI-like domain-containing protein [Bacteroidales bacterium]